MKGKSKVKPKRGGSAFVPKVSKQERWLKDLEEIRQKYSTGKTGPTVEQILEEDRKDRI
jgi:hypothetical protein